MTKEAVKKNQNKNIYRLIPIPCKVFKRYKGRERFPAYSTRPLLLIIKPDIDTARKENYSPKLLISINAKKKKKKETKTN